MLTQKRFLNLLRLSILSATLANAAPIISGLGHKHPLTTPQEGQLLINELRCAACHEGISGEMKSAPNLKEVGSRITGDYLKKYISDPHGTHPGTTMPDVLAGLPATEKEAVSESISHYLMSLTAGDTNQFNIVEAKPKAGEKLYHEIGCVACHSPQDSDLKALPGTRPLTHLKGKYQQGELAKFLTNPIAVRPSGRMPDLKLTTQEASALESYLSGLAQKESNDPEAELIRLGALNFKKYNCIACHDLDGSQSKLGPKLSNLKLDHGCLTNQKANYQLNNSQKDSIRAALTKPLTLTKEDHVKMKLTSLNCIACHERDDFGGVQQELDRYFHSTEEALGNEARIPPPLTQVGGKLKPTWLQKVLYDGMSVRPYMTTRMPQYGRQALHNLPELLVEVDQIPELEIEPPSREERPMINNGGHLLLGTEGLNCISCHNYNGKDSPGMKGYDLIWTYQRLQPAWFSNFMQNPAKHRPGIIMPNYWPAGDSIQKDILGGERDEQLRALWFQFSLGRSARDPKGLSSKPNELLVTEKVRVYRGRSKIAGYRGIAVGYPEGLNYSFNAHNGSLTSIWKGKFVTANWRSQAAGDFTPIGKPVILPPDLAFIKKDTLSQDWPLMPVTSKEEPENPDPLYPSNHGYAFRGYLFDTEGNPTFNYKCDDLTIEDHSRVTSKNTLERTLLITSKKEENVLFRALTGAIANEDAGKFKTNKLRLHTGSTKTILRNRSTQDDQELLLELPLTKGTSRYTISYELLQ